MRKLVISIIIVVICIVASIVITKAICNSDMPLWLKFWLLK